MTATPLPTLFLSHGAPTLALTPGATGNAWATLARALPRPRAVVAVSAHWSTPTTRVGNAPGHDTIHDFYGFPEPLYRLRYDAPGDPALAIELADILRGSGRDVVLDAQRGLDHGAWIPLREMYPRADVPVVPLSIDARRDAAWHYRLGQDLAAGLPGDVLLLASGGLTHNLYEFRPGEAKLPPPDYVGAFQDWMRAHLEAGDRAALLDYRRLMPQAERAHPTDDHLLPLYVALGAAGPDVRAQRVFAAVTERILAMDVYRFERGAAGTPL